MPNDHAPPVDAWTNGPYWRIAHQIRGFGSPKRSSSQASTSSLRRGLAAKASRSGTSATVSSMETPSVRNRRSYRRAARRVGSMASWSGG